MILLDEQLVMLERFKCEVDILLRLAYKFEDSSSDFQRNCLINQLDCVSVVFEDIKRIDYFSH